MKVCEARQRMVEFKDEIWIETEGLWSKAAGEEFKDEV